MEVRISAHQPWPTVVVATDPGHRPTDWWSLPGGSLRGWHGATRTKRTNRPRLRKWRASRHHSGAGRRARSLAMATRRWLLKGQTNGASATRKMDESFGQTQIFWFESTTELLVSHVEPGKTKLKPPGHNQPKNATQEAKKSREEPEKLWRRPKTSTTDSVRLGETCTQPDVPRS